MLKRCVIDGLWLSVPTAMITFGILVEVVGYLWLPVYLLTTPWNFAVFGEAPSGWRHAVFVLGAHVNGFLIAMLVRRTLGKIGPATGSGAGDGTGKAPKDDEATIWAIIIGGFTLVTVLAIAAFVYVLRG
jgi:hypothetical protein